MSIQAKPFALLPICAAAVTIFGGVIIAAPAQADGGCVKGDVAGQVPRKANDTDMVCVSPAIAELVQQENANKDAGYAGGGAYGPLTCINGLVWREAYDGDGICVTPARRTETWQENANAGVGATGGLKPNNTNAGGNPTGGNVGTGGPDPALLAAVNDARAHPEKYPPNGDANAGEGAKMTACSNPFVNSASLASAAATHNQFIAGPGAGGDPHQNASGKQSWADGGPIQAAGYNSWRAEIVAIGQGNENGAVVDWMQNDANASPPWGHRNNILNCGALQAGAAHLSGGPQGNYWTVDIGTP
jgi:cysteine-rich secretory family protein